MIECARCLANNYMHGDPPREARVIFAGESLCYEHFRRDHLSKFDTTVPKGGT